MEVEITLVEELTLRKLAGYGMLYMVKHPLRQGWQQAGYRIRVQEDTAEAAGQDCIAIARGPRPQVRGPEGAVLGLILEPEPGCITAAKLFTADRQQAGGWWTVDENRNLIEVDHEKETG